MHMTARPLPEPRRDNDRLQVLSASLPPDLAVCLALNSMIELRKGWIDNPADYATALDGGIDVYVQFGSENIPASYSTFLPTIARNIRIGGCLITDDHLMQSPDHKNDPKPHILASGHTFIEVPYSSEFINFLDRVPARERTRLTVSVFKRVA